MKGRTGKKPPDKLMPEPHGPIGFDARGGTIKRKHGGKVGGEKVKPRADKMARGGDPKWIEKAQLKKGAFTSQAEKAGKSVHAYAEEKKNASGKTGKRARLALTFQKMAHKD